MSLVAIDLETNLAHDTIWCMSLTDGDETFTVYDAESAKKALSRYTELTAHNGIGFDYPVLERVWGIDLSRFKLMDTLVLARLYRPVIKNGHSLKAWGKRMKFDKLDFDVEDFDGGLTDEMIEYCERDTEVCFELHRRLMKKLAGNDQAIEIEHAVAEIICKQEKNGFAFDEQQASLLHARVQDRMYEIESSLQTVFPPIVHERWSEKTGKRLKDKVEVFNPGSRQQIARRLQSLGWKPTKFTEAGNVIVDETTLEGLDFPEGLLMGEYLMLQKRDGMLKAWFKAVTTEGRIHGRVNPNGAVTGRMTHSNPNLGQIPSTKKPFGKECRALFTVEEGNVLVGSDLSGIELRCLAHYMDDPDYTRELLEGDIHTVNQHAAGLSTRDQAKTFIYAFLYGAGAEKIGSIVGGSSARGKKLIENFLAAVPKLGDLKRRILREMKVNRKRIKGLDGRWLEVRSEHSALNTLLQNAGAIVAKQWLIELHKELDARDLEVKQVAMVHDEVQIECHPDIAEEVAQICRDAAVTAGEVLGMNCPVAAEADIGRTWLETH